MKTLTVNISSGLFQSTSRGASRSSNLRSQMLKQIMPKFSGDRGKALEKAFAEKNSDQIRAILMEITSELAPNAK